MNRLSIAMVAMVAAIEASVAVQDRGPTAHAATARALGPIADWSLEAQRAIVPPPAGVGDTFPGEAAVYMAIVHVAIHDALIAVRGGYRPYAIALTAPAETAPAAAIASAAHGVLVGLLPAQRADLDEKYREYVARLPNDRAKTNGIALGTQVAERMLAMRINDGRNAAPQYVQQPPAGPGVFEPDPTRPVLGVRLSRMRPVALESPSQFRPHGPPPLASREYAAGFEEVKRLGRVDSIARTDEQTSEALFWTDHDLRQWNEGLLRLAADRRLDWIQTARMLALSHVSGGDAMIACFDAKYHYRFWRPAAAVAVADTDENPATEPDASWRPLRATPNFPEYPSAHACHSSALVEALGAFFGTDDVPLVLDSTVTGTTRSFNRLHDVVKDVEQARVLAGFHFRNSDLEGSNLGRKVARFVIKRFFRPPG